VQELTFDAEEVVTAAGKAAGRGSGIRDPLLPDFVNYDMDDALRAPIPPTPLGVCSREACALGWIEARQGSVGGFRTFHWQTFLSVNYTRSMKSRGGDHGGADRLGVMICYWLDRDIPQTKSPLHAPRQMGE